MNTIWINLVTFFDACGILLGVLLGIFFAAFFLVRQYTQLKCIAAIANHPDGMTLTFVNAGDPPIKVSKGYNHRFRPEVGGYYVVCPCLGEYYLSAEAVATDDYIICGH